MRRTQYYTYASKPFLHCSHLLLKCCLKPTTMLVQWNELLKFLEQSAFLCIRNIFTVVLNYLQRVLQLFFISKATWLYCFTDQGNAVLPCMIVASMIVASELTIAWAVLKSSLSVHISGSSPRNPSGNPSIANIFQLALVTKSTRVFWCTIDKSTTARFNVSFSPSVSCAALTMACLVLESTSWSKRL